MDYEDEAGLFAEELRRDEIVDDLDRLLVRAKEVSFGAEGVRRGSGHPAKDSSAEVDAGSVTNGPEKLGELRMLPIWLEAAAEQLRAVAAAHHYGTMLFAPAPLLRSVLELSARTCWVLDAEGPEERFERAWLAWLVSCGEDADTAAMDPTGAVLAAPASDGGVSATRRSLAYSGTALLAPRSVRRNGNSARRSGSDPPQ